MDKNSIEGEKTVNKFKHALKIMRITLFFLFSCILLSEAANSYSQETEFVLHLKSTSIKEICEEIEKKSDFRFVFAGNAKRFINKKVDITASTQNIDEILSNILSNTGLKYKILDNQVVVYLNEDKKTVETIKEITSELIIQQQKKKISGTITDKDGVPIIGANIVEKGTTNGTVSDIDGSFTLSIDQDAVILISYIGYLAQEFNTIGRTSFNMILEEDMKALEEVVVVGYGTQRKETLTGAITSINSSEITTTKTNNAVSNLQGKVSGLLIRQERGEPGDFENANNVSIRGFGTPVVVIDGVARTRNGISDLSQLNSEDIESITLLKDASAAIYGMNASNGVIIVTTKRGEAGKTRFSYTGRLAMQMATGYPDQVDAYTYRVMANEYQRNVGQPPKYSDEILQKYKDGVDGYQTWDWVDRYLYKVVPNQSHTITARGGTDKVNFFTSLGYSEDNGLLTTDAIWYKRYVLRNNLTVDLTDDLKMNVSISGQFGKRQQGNDEFTWYYKNIVVNDRGIGPYALGSDPSQGHFSIIGPEERNNEARADPDIEGYRRTNTFSGTSSIDFTYSVPSVKGLDFNLFGSFDIRENNYWGVAKAYDLYDYYTDTYVKSTGRDDVWSNMNLYSKTYTKFQANYSLKRGDHSVSLMGAAEASQERFDGLRGYRQYTDLFTHDILDMASSTGQTNSGSREFRRYAAFIGRLNYDFQGKYLIEGMLRRDGSYRYAPSKKWVVFPSVSVGWRISEENFFKNNIVFFNSLKLRSSYGQSGRDQGNAHQYIAGYDTSESRGYLFDEGKMTVGMFPPGVVNDFLSWVTSNTFNLGVDMDFLKSKFSSTFEFYQRKNTGLLATRNSDVPNTFGASFPQENINSDMNIGLEMSLKYRDKIGKDFSYTIGTNATYARYKRLYVESTPYTSQWNNWKNNNNDRYQGRRALYTWSGQFASLSELETYPLMGGARGNSVILPGAYRLEDNNGDGIIDSNDQLYIAFATGGSVMPPLQFGFTLDAKYKDFDLALLLQGASLYTQNITVGNTFGYGQFPTVNVMYMDRWHTPVISEKVDESGVNHTVYADPLDPNTVWIPGRWPAGRPHNYSNTMDTAAIDRVYPNATYLRLKTVEIGYTIPRVILNSVGLDSFRFFVNATNLFTFCNKDLKLLDPEKSEAAGGFDAQLAYPLMKGVNFGINLTF